MYFLRQKSSKDDELITTATKFASKPGLFVFIELLEDYDFPLLLSFVLFIYIWNRIEDILKPTIEVTITRHKYKIFWN